MIIIIKKHAHLTFFYNSYLWKKLRSNKVKEGICFSWPSTPYVVPSAPGPVKFLIAVFDFLPVCVIKCSCAALINRAVEQNICFFYVKSE